MFLGGEIMPIKRYFMNKLAQFRWFRKHIGGHWERRWFSPTFSDWYKPIKCNRGRSSYCVECENYEL